MNLLSDIITYVRRIIKSPSNAVITDSLIIDYINRFWIMDVDARIQLFDLKTRYQFQTVPGVDQYNMPLYDVQTAPTASNQNIGMYPVYQGFTGPVNINGIQTQFYTEKSLFYNVWPNRVQYLQNLETGDGSTLNFDISFPILSNSTPPNPPVQGILRGHVDMAGIISTSANVDPPVGLNFNTSIPVTSVQPRVTITSQASDGSNLVVTDSGQFLSTNINYGLLMLPGNAPFGNTALGGGYSTTVNTVNYLTGSANVTFPSPPADGAFISAQVYYFQTGLPCGVLYYNNTLTLRNPPDKQYTVELDAYLTPAAFFNTANAIPFGYMAEYIARGAARKILSDTGDVEQFQFYEPLFQEQELLVWKRSQRQWTSTRTHTIYSSGMGLGGFGYNNFGGGSV